MAPPPDPKFEVEPELPLAFGLRQNYPNPFNPATTIAFTLEAPAYTVITVYNILGQVVTTLANAVMEAGEHSIIWDGTNGSGHSIASGIYFYTIQSGENFQSKKMALLR